MSQLLLFLPADFFTHTLKDEVFCYLSLDTWGIICNSFYSVSDFLQTASGASLVYRHCICTNITFYRMLAELMPCFGCGPKRNSSVKEGRSFRLKSQRMLRLAEGKVIEGN